jgi:hypothetical protein
MQVDAAGGAEAPPTAQLGCSTDLTFRSDAFVRFLRAFYTILELAVPFRQLLSHFVRPRRRFAMVPRVGFKSHGLADLEFMHGVTPLLNRREHYRTLSHRRLNQALGRWSANVRANQKNSESSMNDPQPSRSRSAVIIESKPGSAATTTTLATPIRCYNNPNNFFNKPHAAAPTVRPARAPLYQSPQRGT